jgi:dolichyl-phosphate beta-glucosyltransferase
VSDVIIVVPCYNEARRLETDKFLACLDRHPRVAFLFVNDGSTDETSTVLAGLHAAGGERARVLDYGENQGKAEAVRRGVLAAIELAPAYVGYWDADLATPLSELPAFLETVDARPSVELVMGARIKLLGRRVVRRLARHYLGRVFATAASITLELGVYDTQCGAKLFRVTPALRQIFADPFISRWIFDVEIIARMIAVHRGNGGKVEDVIYELPLLEWKDVGGSRIKLMDWPIAFFDLMKIYFRYLK